MLMIEKRTKWMYNWAFNSVSDQYQYANPVPTSILGDKLARMLSKEGNVLFNDALNTLGL